MRIGIDAMGGDYAPESVVLGAIEARKELSPEVEIVLLGDKDAIVSICRKEGFEENRLSIVHAPTVISMGENPARAYAQKQDSSIALGFRMLVRGELDAFSSAGNTGAMMAGASITAKAVPGIIRPAISAKIPTLNGKPIVLLDVGLNPDARPDVLYQYGILGSVYARTVLGIPEPRVGLLNIGTEEEKGNLVTKAAYQLMRETNEFLFVGNTEGHNFFDKSKQDVIVCDGFVGNILLKEAESLYYLVKQLNIQHPFFEGFNYENFGGTPVLGLNYPVIIGHGISNARAIKNMIFHTYHVVESGMIKKIKEAFQ